VPSTLTTLELQSVGVAISQYNLGRHQHVRYIAIAWTSRSNIPLKNTDFINYWNILHDFRDYLWRFSSDICAFIDVIYVSTAKRAVLSFIYRFLRQLFIIQILQYICNMFYMIQWDLNSGAMGGFANAFCNQSFHEIQPWRSTFAIVFLPHSILIHNLMLYNQSSEY
jgi:hypothetical protein